MDELETRISIHSAIEGNAVCVCAMIKMHVSFI